MGFNAGQVLKIFYRKSVHTIKITSRGEKSSKEAGVRRKGMGNGEWGEGSGEWEDAPEETGGGGTG